MKIVEQKIKKKIGNLYYDLEEDTKDLLYNFVLHTVAEIDGDAAFIDTWLSMECVEEMSLSQIISMFQEDIKNEIDFLIETKSERKDNFIKKHLGGMSQKDVSIAVRGLEHDAQIIKGTEEEIKEVLQTPMR